MRLLFVSSTMVGGSGRSQRELAARLLARGHEALFVVDDDSPARARRLAYEQLSDLAARLGRRPGSNIVRFIERLPGKRTRSTDLGGIEHRTTPVPENAIAGAIASFRPDVVVGNSVLRMTWRKTRELCERRGVATVLYVREVASMNHFTHGVPPADRVVANASGLALEVEALGYACSMLPSVIEIDVTEVSSTRRAALFINPIVSHGIDTVWRLAAGLPEVPIVVQQSWPLSDDALVELKRQIVAYPNIEFRGPIPPGTSLYRDAKMLLVPHRIDNRPRVIAEAQANGIPVVASLTPGLAEAVGDGGVLLDMDDVDGWVSAIRRLWTDDVAYTDLVERALAHSRRPEIDPDRVAAAFEALAIEAIEHRMRRGR